MKFRFQDLIIRASKEVSERKAATQTGFKKLSYPQFNGDVLNYQEFKKRWQNEVIPEQKPAALELAALRESVPTLAKAMIIATTTMSEAWKLLDLDYSNLQEVRAKLKQQVRNLKIKATSGPAKIVELFHQVQLIAAKIKATGSISLLENDEEYVALVRNHLSNEIMWEWWKSKKSGWTNFYLFLEDSASTAKEQLTAQSIMSALSGEKGDKVKCPNCCKITQESATRSLQLSVMESHVLSVRKLPTNINLKLDKKLFQDVSRTVQVLKMQMRKKMNKWLRRLKPGILYT